MRGTEWPATVRRTEAFGTALPLALRSSDRAGHLRPFLDENPAPRAGLVPLDFEKAVDDPSSRDNVVLSRAGALEVRRQLAVTVGRTYLALVQPLCAMMPIAEEQSKLMAAYLTGDYHLPSAEAMVREMVAGHEHMKAKFTHSKRHTIEIDCQKYTYELWQELAKGRKRAARAGNGLPVPPKA